MPVVGYFRFHVQCHVNTRLNNLIRGQKDTVSNKNKCRNWKFNVFYPLDALTV